MKPFVMFALLLTLLPYQGASIYSQTGPCALKLVDLPQAPELMGFRPGMTLEQVKARVPQVVFGRTDALGSSKTSINPDFDPQIDKATFVGLRTVSLNFLDGRLTSLWLGYDDSFKWQNLDDFVTGISRSLQLPNSWVTWRARGQQIMCADFQVMVVLIAGSPSLRIVDQTAEDILATRRQAREEHQFARDEPRERATEILADRNNKTYYPDGCPPKSAIEGSNRITFKTGEQAERAGYRVPKDCQ